MEERKLKSYDDIGKYIVEQIRMNSVDNLPDEFFDKLGPHAWNYHVALPSGGMYPMAVRHEWQPPNNFELTFLDGGTGMIVSRFVFTRPSPKK